MACNESKIVGVVDVHIHFYTVARVVEHEEKVTVFHLYDAVVGRIGYFLNRCKWRSSFCRELVDAVVFVHTHKVSVQIVVCISRLCCGRHCCKESYGSKKGNKKLFHRKNIFNVGLSDCSFFFQITNVSMPVPTLLYKQGTGQYMLLHSSFVSVIDYRVLQK